jgi:hypothetical protein
VKIEVGKEYTTVGGLTARIYALDGAGNYCIHGAVCNTNKESKRIPGLKELFEGGWDSTEWDVHGVNFDFEHWNLKPKTFDLGIRWTNVYSNGKTGAVYHTKEAAVKEAAKGCIGCVSFQLKGEYF